jgi:hypothetical protein
MTMISLPASGICPLDKTIKTGTTGTTQTRQQQQGSTSIVTELTSRQIISVTR